LEQRTTITLDGDRCEVYLDDAFVNVRLPFAVDLARLSRALAAKGYHLAYDPYLENEDSLDRAGFTGGSGALVRHPEEGVTLAHLPARPIPPKFPRSISLQEFCCRPQKSSCAVTGFPGLN